MNFNGSNTVSLTTSGNLSLINHSFTVEAWVNIYDFSTGDQAILADASSCDLHLIIRGQHPYLGFCGNDIQASTTMNAGTWYHITYQYDISTGTQAIYVNGVLDYSEAGHSPLADDQQVGIGQCPWGTLTGSVDELRIWNYALSQSEIQATMNTELAGNESGLVAYYNFNQGVASANNAGITTLTDKTSNGFNGTLNGFTLNGSTSNWVDGFGSVVTIPPITWTGAVSTDWSDAANWSNGNPNYGGSKPIYIPGSLTNEPHIYDGYGVSVYGDITNDGSITIGNYSNFQIGGNYSGNGVIVGNNMFSPGNQGSTIYIYNNNLWNSNGLTSTTVSLKFDQSTLGGNAIGTLQVQDNVTLNILNHLDVITMLGMYNYNSFGNGPIVQTINTNNNLTLKSTATNTAIIDQVWNVNASGNSNNNRIDINGTVTTERFIPQGYRAYRDLSANGVSGGDLFNGWQESGATKSGYGIYITGKAGVAAGVDPTTGFDLTRTGSPSLYTFSNGTWSAITHTKSSTIDPYMGYRASIRGDRNIANFGFSTDPATMTNSTVIRNSGNLIMGDVLYTTSGVTNDNNLTNSQFNSSYSLKAGQDAYNLVANPFASVIDWSQIVPNINGNNISLSENIYNSYWYFDPTLFNNGYATYVTYNSITGSSNGASHITQYIQPGQSFFIQNSTSSDPVLSFNENSKLNYTAQQNNNSVFGTVTPNRLQVTLWKNINGADANIDGAVAAFNTNFTKAISAEDSKKMLNGGENLSITEGSIDLSIDGLPVPAVNDIVALRLTQLIANTTYQLKVDASNFTTIGMDAYIHDNVTNIDLKASAGLTFTTNTVTVNFKDRYSIVFKAASALNVKIINVKAQQQNKDINVSWTTANEVNIANYQVEKSTNGETFSSINTLSAKNLSEAAYNNLDANVTNAINYYRIKVTEKDGQISYSKVVVVNTKAGNGQIAIYPNPVTGKSFNLQMNNIAKGTYKVSVINAFGQEVMNSTIIHEAGSSSETISTKQLAVGMYTLNVAGNGSSFSAEMIVK